MKHVIVTLLITLAALFAVTGCLSSTGSVIREFDAGTGKLTKETTTTESVIKTVIDSTKHKIVWISDQGWAAGVHFVPPASSAENPAGVLKIVAVKADRTFLSAPVDSIAGRYVVNSIAGFSAMVAAGRAGTLSVTSNGISSVAGTENSTGSSTAADGSSTVTASGSSTATTAATTTEASK